MATMANLNFGDKAKIKQIDQNIAHCATIGDRKK